MAAHKLIILIIQIRYRDGTTSVGRVPPHTSVYRFNNSQNIKHFFTFFRLREEGKNGVPFNDLPNEHLSVSPRADPDQQTAQA